MRRGRPFDPRSGHASRYRDFSTCPQSPRDGPLSSWNSSTLRLLARRLGSAHPVVDARGDALAAFGARRVELRPFAKPRTGGTVAEVEARALRPAVERARARIARQERPRAHALPRRSRELARRAPGPFTAVVG